MKRSLSLKMKLQIFFMWIKQTRDLGLCEVCECCGSAKIRVKLKHSGENNEGYYCATYECLSCGAECVVEEKWYKKK